jgi:hypothetical protein
MKNLNCYFVWILLLSFIVIETNAQPLIWDKSYSFPEKNQELFTKFLQTNNSDLYLAGYAEFGWYGYSPGFMRVDTNGGEIWARNYEFANSYMQFTHTLVQLSENSFFSFCFNPLLDIPVKSNQDSKWPELINDCWLLKLDGNGDTIFTKHFEDIGWVNDLIIDNGKLLAVGSTNYHEGGPDTYFSKTTLMVLDTNGTMLLREEFLTGLDSRANSIVKNENGNYLITGCTTEAFHYFGYFDFPDKMFIIEVDAMGNLLTEYFSDIEYSEGKKIIVCGDGNYAIVGDGLNPVESTIDIVLWKFGEGNNLLQTTFSGLPREDKAYSIKQTPDGGFIICGSIVPMSSTNWNRTFFYMKTDHDGNEEWHTNNVAPNNCAYDVLINNNSGYYIAGKGAGQARLVKADLEGNGLITTSIEGPDISNVNLFEIFPNPGSGHFTILNPCTGSKYGFSLFNIFGNKIIDTESHNENLIIKTSKLPPGLYFYQISIDKTVSQTGKWIKE